MIFFIRTARLKYIILYWAEFTHAKEEAYSELLSQYIKRQIFPIVKLAKHLHSSSD